MMVESDRQTDSPSYFPATMAEFEALMGPLKTQAALEYLRSLSWDSDHQIYLFEGREILTGLLGILASTPQSAPQKDGLSNSE